MCVLCTCFSYTLIIIYNVCVCVCVRVHLFFTYLNYTTTYVCEEFVSWLLYKEHLLVVVFFDDILFLQSVDVIAEYEKRKSSEKPSINLVVIGKHGFM